VEGILKISPLLRKCRDPLRRLVGKAVARERKGGSPLRGDGKWDGIGAAERETAREEMGAKEGGENQFFRQGEGFGRKWGPLVETPELVAGRGRGKDPT